MSEDGFDKQVRELWESSTKTIAGICWEIFGNLGGAVWFKVWNSLKRQGLTE